MDRVGGWQKEVALPVKEGPWSLFLPLNGVAISCLPLADRRICSKVILGLLTTASVP